MKKIIAMLLALTMIATVGVTCVLAAEPTDVQILCDVSEPTELGSGTRLRYDIALRLSGITDSQLGWNKVWDDDEEVYLYNGRSIDAIGITLTAGTGESIYSATLKNGGGYYKEGSVKATTFAGVSAESAGARMFPADPGTFSTNDPFITIRVQITKGDVVHLTPTGTIKINNWAGGTSFASSNVYSNQTGSNLSFDMPTITLGAVATKHTITFVDEDGTTVLDTVEVNDGETPSTAVTPTKAGYTFAGWTPAIAAVTGNATYTATYTVNNYTITFVDEDGTTVLDTKQVAYGATPSTAVTPTKAGYTFAGWTPAIAAVTGDATYTATYEQILYTVTFTDENDSVIKTDNLVPGASIVKPANPTKANAVFVGWSADGGVSVANVPATADKAYTFKAVFKNIPAPVEKEAGAATFKTYTKGEVVSGVPADADYVAADATLTEVDNTLFRYKVVLTGTNKSTGAEETQEFDDIEFGTGAGDGEVELSGATAKLMVIVKAIKHNITKIAIKALGR